MSRKQWLALTMALVLCLGILAGCGDSGTTTPAGTTPADTAPADNAPADSAPPPAPAPAPADEIVELKMAYWANAAEEAYFQSMSAGIESEYPNIRITHQVFPSSADFWTTIPVAIAAGTGPDIIAFSDEGNAEYMANGVLAPLEGLFDPVGFDKAKFLPSLWSGWTYDGNIYGVPYDTSTSMLSINKAMMDAAGLTGIPETMDELLEWAKAMTTGDTYGICIWLMEFHLSQFVHAFGGGWGNGRTIDTPENERGLQFVVDLFTVHNVAITPQEAGAAWDGETFSRGASAMSTGGPWYVGFLADAAPDLDFIAVPIPTGTVARQSAYSHGFSVTASSNYQYEAMQAIKYMTRDEIQIVGIDQVGYCPAVESLIPQYVDSMPLLQPIYANLGSNGTPFSYPVQTVEFTAELAAGMEELIFNPGSGLTVKALLTDLQQRFGS